MADHIIHHLEKCQIYKILFVQGMVLAKDVYKTKGADGQIDANYQDFVQAILDAKE